MAGWIKVHRSLLGWEWYKDINTKVVFLHLLLLANHGISKYKGFTLCAGQLITSVAEIADATGLSTKQVRTALNHLKTTSEVAIKTTNKFSLVTLENWEFYQSLPDVGANKTASNGANEGQARGKQRASIIEEEKEFENEKTKRNISTPPKAASINFIPPTIEEVAAYCRERGNGIDPESFINFYVSKGWMIGKNKMRDWKAAVRTWEKNNKGGAPYGNNASIGNHGANTRKNEEPGSLSTVF